MPIETYALVYLLILAFVLGACIGSFVNCAADRYKVGQSVLKGRSHCPICGSALTVPDLVPVLSYICLKGKCRHCGAPIPIRCLVTEVIGGIVFFSFAYRYGFSFETLEYLILASALYAVALIDLDTMEIPDRLLLFGLLVFWLFLPTHDMTDRLLGGALGAVCLGGGMLILSLIMDKILKRDSLGGGDIKLFALLGMFFGLGRGLLMLVLSCIIGLVFAFAKKSGGKEFPFGPSIVAAAWITALFGRELVDMYLSLF